MRIQPPHCVNRIVGGDASPILQGWHWVIESGCLYVLGHLLHGMWEQAAAQRDGASPGCFRPLSEAQVVQQVDLVVDMPVHRWQELRSIKSPDQCPVWPGRLHHPMHHVVEHAHGGEIDLEQLVSLPR